MLSTLFLTCALFQSPADDAAVALALAKAKREREAVKADVPATPAAKEPAVTQKADVWAVTIDGREYTVPLSYGRETAVSVAKKVHAERAGSKAAETPAAAPKFRTEYRTKTVMQKVCNGNGTCRLVPQTITEAVQVPE